VKLSLEEFEKRVRKAVTSGRELSTLWAVVQKVREITSSPNASMKELVKVIGADSVLTSKILRIVNSAAYGFNGRISNIDQAIVIMGFQQLRDLCVGLTLMKGVGAAAPETPFDRIGLWKHSLGTAVTCKLIQERLAGNSSSNLFVAGLLCNIGRLVLDQHFPDEFAMVMKLAQKQGIRLIEAERRILDVTHAEIGCWATQAWSLEDNLSQCIRDHHGPSGNRNAAIVNLAYVITQVRGIGSPGDPLLTLLIPGTLETLKIGEFELTQLLRDLEHEYKTLEPMFAIMMEK
jgi:HD-like signal output (HDOD) protein